jgi:hypothetical protein
MREEDFPGERSPIADRRGMALKPMQGQLLEARTAIRSNLKIKIEHHPK